METGAAVPLTAVPPYGHVISSERWRNSSLIQSLKAAGVRVLFEDGLGGADFHLPNNTCVLYVSECDVIAGSSYKRKLVRFRNTGAAVPLTAVPPYGHVISSERWRNSSLIQSLKAAGVRVLFEDGLGGADFHLPNNTCVLYVSECDVIAGSSYKRKLVRFRNSGSRLQELVLVESTRLSAQFFPAVQRLVVLDLGLTVLPVSGQAEASQLISQVVHGGGRENPFRRRPPSRLLDPLVLHAVQQVPGVGRVKALALLQTFSSIQQLCSAGPAQLEPIVGAAAAQQVHRFFHGPTAAGP